MTFDLVQVLTVGGPVAAIALMTIWVNYKLVTTLMSKLDQMQATDREVIKALGEVCEALRRLNGKSPKQE